MNRTALLAKPVDIMHDIQGYYNLQMTVSRLTTLPLRILMICPQFGSQPDYVNLDAILAIDTIGISVQSRLAAAEACNQMRLITNISSVFGQLAQITWYQCLYLALFLLYILHLFIYFSCYFSVGLLS